MCIRDSHNSAVMVDEDSPSDPIEEDEKEPARKSSFEPKASNFKRFVLTKDWDRVKEPVQIFKSSLSIKQLHECHVNLVKLSDGEVVEAVEFDISNDGSWNINSQDVGGQVKTVAILSFSEEVKVGKLEQKVDDMRDIGEKWSSQVG